MSLARLSEYAGTYVGIVRADTTRFDVSVAPGGDGLSLYNAASRRSIPLVAVGGDVFVGLEGGGEWTFERDGQGTGAAVRGLAIGSGANRRVLIRR
jgi:hypothetical protein